MTASLGYHQQFVSPSCLSEVMPLGLSSQGVGDVTPNGLDLRSGFLLLVGDDDDGLLALIIMSA